MQKFKVADTYYVGIELDKAMENPGGDEDITLREGDKIIVPVYNGTVKINGAVLYPNTVNYTSGKKFKHYLSQAGGFSSSASKKGAYIVYQNGNAAKVSDGAKPEPGCEIIVPYKTKKVQNVQQWISIGTGVASLATIVATLANILN
jgi:protein involved in polysaccharide export with SLBB domain